MSRYVPVDDMLAAHQPAERGRAYTWHANGQLLAVNDQIIRDRPQPLPRGSLPAPCGTRAAYERHRKNHEPIDPECREANRDANRMKRAAR